MVRCHYSHYSGVWEKKELFFSSSPQTTTTSVFHQAPVYVTFTSLNFVQEREKEHKKSSDHSQG
jgi:hypothetical protein